MLPPYLFSKKVFAPCPVDGPDPGIENFDNGEGEFFSSWDLIFGCKCFTFYLSLTLSTGPDLRFYFELLWNHPMEPGNLHSVYILHTWHIILHRHGISSCIDMAYHLSYLGNHLTYFGYHLAYDFPYMQDDTSCMQDDTPYMQDDTPCMQDIHGM